MRLSFPLVRRTSMVPLRSPRTWHSLRAPGGLASDTGLLTVMFAVTGTGFSAAKRLTNDGKVRSQS